MTLIVENDIKLINQSINQSINHSINQSINQYNVFVYGSVVVEHPPYVREVAGLIHGRVIPNKVKMKVMAVHPWRSEL